jgi:hypothetical protein
MAGQSMNAASVPNHRQQSRRDKELTMKWEPNITGYRIGIGRRQAVKATTEGVPTLAGRVVHAKFRARPTSMDLSDNVLLAHYQRERR